MRQRSDEYDEEDEGEDEDDEEYYEGGHSGVQRGGGVMGGGGGGEGNSMLTEVTVKSGYLWKKGEKRKVSLCELGRRSAAVYERSMLILTCDRSTAQNWKKRWFVLRSSKLCYYKNEKEYQLLRFIDMSEVHTVAAIEVKKQDNTFGIVTPKRAYYVKASTPAESHDWIRALNHVKAQMSHRNSISQEMEDLRMSAPQHSQQAADNMASSSTARPNRERSRSSSQAAAERAASAAAAATTSSGPPISISIPGKGLYVAPAQPRAISGGGAPGSGAPGGSFAAGSDAFSPLTATTDSDTGADRYGLSYASSAGLSLGSSPGRETNIHQHWSGSEVSEGGSANPRSANSPPRRGGAAQGQSSRGRDISVGSSGAEGYLGEGIGSYQSSSAAVLSSSDEEDEADNNEQLDQAMPLPMRSSAQQGGAADPVSAQATPTQSLASQPAPIQSYPQSQSQSQSQSQPPGDALLRDPHRVIIQGYLMKQSNRRKHWRKRWFVLTASQLMYTRSHMDAKANRQIPLTSILDAIEYTAKKANTPGSPGGGFGSPLTGGGGGFSFNALAGHGYGGGGEGSSGGQQDMGEGASSSGKPERRQSVVAAVASNLNSLGTGGGVGGSGGVSSSNTHPAGSSGGLTGGGGGASGGPTSTSGGIGIGGGSASGGGSMASSSDAGKKRTDNSFKIITPKRTFLLCAPSEEEEIKWLSALHALLTRTRGASSVPTLAPAPGGGRGTGGGIGGPASGQGLGGLAAGGGGQQQQQQGANRLVSPPASASSTTTGFHIPPNQQAASTATTGAGGAPSETAGSQSLNQSQNQPYGSGASQSTVAASLAAHTTGVGSPSAP